MIRKKSQDTIAPYLKDASNYFGGAAKEVLIPENLSEIAQFLKNDSRPVTVAGAGTGLNASRIPSEGVIISLERFDEIEEVKNGEVW